jgi:SP family facilitated glucose transporter-like MFS transporter 8
MAGIDEFDNFLLVAKKSDLDGISNDYESTSGELGDESNAQSYIRRIFSYCYVYYAIVASLGAVSFGFAAVFSSPFLEEMSRRENFTLWIEGFDNCIYQNLIGPLTPIGAVVGGLLGSLVIALFGLVFSLIASAATFVLGWTMLGVSWFLPSPSWFRVFILLGRTVTGLATGWVATTIPVYVAELAPTEDARGRLGVLFQIGIGLGVFACFVIGNYITYWQLAFLFLGYAVIQGLLPFFIKESPSRTRNMMDNCKALCCKGKHDHHEVLAKNKYINQIFLLLCFITISLFSLQQLTGLNAISFYAGPIFLSAGGENWSISPGLVAAIAIGITQILSPIVSFFIINKMSRTLFFFFGALGMMVGNIGIASYFAIVNGVVPVTDVAVNGTNDSNNLCFFGIPSPATSSLGQQYSPLAILSIALFVVSFVIGWNPPLYVYAAEVFTNKTRGVGLGLGIASNWLTVAVITFLFPLSSQYIGPSLTFFILAFISLVAAIFIVFFVPETKGREMGYHASQNFSISKIVKDFWQNLHTCLCPCCRRKCSHCYHVN